MLESLEGYPGKSLNALKKTPEQFLEESTKRVFLEKS